mgnify:CR=1 FL=1
MPLVQMVTGVVLSRRHSSTVRTGGSGLKKLHTDGSEIVIDVYGAMFLGLDCWLENSAMAH